METIYAHPLASAVLAIAILFGRGIEDIPDLYEKCKLICKAAEKYHNKQLMLEMKNFDSFIKDTAAAIEFPIDKVSLFCTEQPLSLLERYKLKEVIENVGKFQSKTYKQQSFLNFINLKGI